MGMRTLRDNTHLGKDQNGQGFTVRGSKYRQKEFFASGSGPIGPSRGAFAKKRP
jgi:hypothetical protein